MAKDLQKRVDTLEGYINVLSKDMYDLKKKLEKHGIR
jgi:hypothetical protein